MAAAELDGRQQKDWVKVQVKPETYARLSRWVEAQYPDVRMRPPKRDAAELLLSLALDQAEEAVKPEPSPLERLAALRAHPADGGRS